MARTLGTPKKAPEFIGPLPPTPEQIAAMKRAEQQAAFLGILRNSANVRAACQVAGIPRRTVYHWYENDPAFAAAWQEAIDDSVDTLEATAWTRARGVEQKRPIFYNGKQVGEEISREYSDTLLIFLLKAHRPEKYRETVNVNLYIQQEAARVSAATGMPLTEAEAKIRAVLQGVGYGGR